MNPKKTKKTKSQLEAELEQLRQQNEQFRAEAEQRLHASAPSELMLLEMISRSPVSIQIMDKEGISVMINEAHTRVFGLRPPGGYNMFHDPLLLEQGLADSFRRLQEGEAVFFPDTWYNPSLLDANFPDKLIWVKTLGFPLLKEKTTPKGYVVMHEDITELIRLKNELKDKNENIRYLYDNFQARLEMQRKSIAVEIHDRLIQDLTAHKVKLAILKTRCTDQAMIEELKQEIIYVNAIIKSSRKILNSVWPAILDSQGLEVAIAAYLKKFSNKRRIAVVWDAEAASEITNEVAYPLYMIFQEAMVNIVKHARAKNVRISLKQENEQLHLMVSDDGRGFDEAKAFNKKSFGLFMMKDLMNSLGGSFNISKGEPQGTIIDCVVPVKTDVK